jgi:hypothetical protein
MGDARRFANLVMILGAIAAGIVLGIWVFEAVTG